MRRKAVSLLLVAMMMSVAVPVHASEQATVTIQESQGENREIDQVQSSETTESKSSTSQITTTAERKEEVTSTHKKKQNKKKDNKKEKKVKKLKKTKKKEKVVHVKIKPTISSSYQEQSIKIKKNKEYIGKFIYFNQGDAAWNSSGYGIRAAGCGPTSMAVCISTLTGKWVTPVDTTSWAYEQGYYSSAGSEHRAIPAMAEHWGLKCDGLGTNYQKIKESLKHGRPVVSLMGSGYFTRGGHFMVLTEIDSNDNVTVADVGSRKRSQYKYSLHDVISQSKVASAGGPFWSIYKQGKAKTQNDSKSNKQVLKSTTPATCGIGEIQHYKCSVCGKTKDVTLDNPLSHAWDSGKVTKEPTCTETGIKTFTCTNCGTTREETINATGHLHKETKNQKAATCTEDGYTGDIYCSDCGTKLESGTVINKLGHTWDNGVITKEATETEEGIKTYTCKTCGETKTESIPVTSHHWDQGTITKKATCTENGEKTYHCTDEECDKTYVETIPATGHQHTELRDKKAATCEEDGYSGNTYCKDCGQLISKGAVVKATGHSWDSGKVTEAATCKKEGTKTYTCSICGDTKTEAIPKKDHTWDEGKVTKKATCTEDGLKVYTCRVCAETKEEVLKATGHQHTELRNEKKATCTEEGYTGDTYCTDCGELIKKGSVTEKANHNWQLTKEEKATCEKDGSKTYTCADCKETKTETIPTTGHKFGDWQTVTTQSVFTGGVQKRICSICGKEETRNVGNQLKATIKTNASSLKLKRKQATKKFVVSGLAAGDSVKSWTSSNQKIVKVFGSRNGACTIKAGNKTGKAKITITLASGLKKTINVTVQKNAVACTSIKNVPKKLILNRKKYYQLRPVINPITCTSKAKYKTSNKKIVKVTSRGKITAVKKGKAKITVMVGKKKFVCTVTIK